MEKEGRMNEDIGGPPSQVTYGMVGIHFLLLFRHAKSVNARSGFLNLQQMSQVPQPRRAALAVGCVSARAARDSGKSAAECYAKVY